jgi:hypothetical protein
MTTDKMPIDIMPIDKMPEDKMPFCRVGTETNYFKEFKVYICYDGTLSVLP